VPGDAGGVFFVDFGPGEFVSGYAGGVDADEEFVELRGGNGEGGGEGDAIAGLELWSWMTFILVVVFRGEILGRGGR